MNPAPTWPVPKPSWRARRYCATKFTDKTVTYHDGDLQLGADRNGAPSVERRLRRLRSGDEITLNLLIDGRLSWCPPPPWHHPVRLTAHGATSDGGGGPTTVRPIPLDQLQIVDATLLDPPGRPMVPGLETWTLRVRDPDGTAEITGLLADLALLAAVARWPAPTSLSTHQHAGAPGAPKMEQPTRPPIRPLGWAMIALGAAMLVGFIVLLALTDGRHGGGRASLGSLGALLIAGGWQVRRRRDRSGTQYGVPAQERRPET